MPIRRKHSIVISGLLLGSLLNTVWAQHATKQATCTLVVHVVKLHNNRGDVPVSLFGGPKGFPGDPARAVQRQTAIIQNKTAAVTFVGLPPGDYAVSFFHDENRDKRLNRNFLGIPKEGYGASRNAHNAFGPPSWQAAKITLTSGETTIELHPYY